MAVSPNEVKPVPQPGLASRICCWHFCCWHPQIALWQLVLIGETLLAIQHQSYQNPTDTDNVLNFLATFRKGYTYSTTYQTFDVLALKSWLSFQNLGPKSATPPSDTLLGNEGSWGGDPLMIAILVAHTLGLTPRSSCCWRIISQAHTFQMTLWSSGQFECLAGVLGPDEVFTGQGRTGRVVTSQ